MTLTNPHLPVDEKQAVWEKYKRSRGLAIDGSITREEWNALMDTTIENELLNPWAVGDLARVYVDDWGLSYQDVLDYCDSKGKEYVEGTLRNYKSCCVTFPLQERIYPLGINIYIACKAYPTYELRHAKLLEALEHGLSQETLNADRAIFKAANNNPNLASIGNFIYPRRITRVTLEDVNTANVFEQAIQAAGEAAKEKIDAVLADGKALGMSITFYTYAVPQDSSENAETS